MTIVHKLEDGWFEANTLDELFKKVKEFLVEHHVLAEVVQENDCVVVSIDDPNDIDANEDMNIALSFCNARRFGKAKKVLKEFLEKKPYFSEAHRLLAQIEMEDGKFDDAIEQCFVSLRFDPKNLYALILLGNLYARDKNDPVQGRAFYKRAYEMAPDSELTVTNYAAALMQGDSDKDEQERLFNKAIKIAPKYLNAYYGLASIHLERSQFKEAFDVANKGLVNGIDRPENPAPIKKVLTEIMVRTAKQVIEDFDDGIVDRMISELRKVGGVDVRVEKDESIPVPAKMELADRYGRDYHRLVYNPKMIECGHQYFVMHEIEKQLKRAGTR